MENTSTLGECVHDVFAIYDNNISPSLLMIIIKIIILYFIQIRHTDNFPPTGTPASRNKGQWNAKSGPKAAYGNFAMRTKFSARLETKSERKGRNWSNVAHTHTHTHAAQLVVRILASVLTRVPPLKFPSLHIPLPPTLPLPSFPRPVHAYVPSSLVPFLASSTPLPRLPLPPTHPHIIASPLPRLTPSLPTLLLPPSHSPSFLSPSLPPFLPGLPACLSPCNSMYTVCVFGKLHYIV